MANTYTQMFIQVVFAVEERQCLISKRHKEELYKYITGTLKKRNQKLLAINGLPDHIHIPFSMTPEIALSDLVQDVKAASPALINDKRWVRGHFNQEHSACARRRSGASHYMEENKMDARLTVSAYEATRSHERMRDRCDSDLRLPESATHAVTGDFYAKMGSPRRIRI